MNFVGQIKSSRSVADVKAACAIFDRFKVVEDTMPLLLRGMEVKEQYGTQYFDSLIIATAEKGLCEVLYSEDLNDGQVYCGVKAVNPFP